MRSRIGRYCALVACLGFPFCLSCCAAANTEQHTQTEPLNSNNREKILTPWLIREVVLEWVPVQLLLDDEAVRWLSRLEGRYEGRADAVGLPLEPFLRLRATTSDAQQAVSWPSDLQGLVRIASEEQAIEFVRLFTSVDTWYRFPAFNYIEIIASPTEREGQFAPLVVSPSDFKALDVPTIAVTRTEGVFRIRRTLLQLGNGSAEVVIVDEHVWPNGRYALIPLARAQVSRQDLRLRLRPFK